jgi:K+-transporting ATPase ATPase A chain
MTTSAWGLLALFLTVLLVAAWPLGIWLARLSSGKLPVWMHRVEAPLYRLAGTSPDQSMTWKQYALSLLAFSALGVLAVYALQRLQAGLPLNPAGMAAVSPDSAFNTAVSFVTNTNWQGYAGESTMSYLTQMLALAVQNFLSAATGIAVVFALIRGFAARSTGVIGNFWVDITRTTWLLVPLSLVFAVFLVGQGVIQNFDAYKDVTTLEVTSYQSPKNGPDGQPLKDEKGNPVMEDMKAATQTLAMGPVASQEAIKMLGTNGGGFFNANSAHPYENPTALSNFLQMLAIFLIPAALCFAFGREVGDLRQGWAVLAAMTVMFVIAVVAITPAEQAGNPLLTPMGVDQTLSSLQSGGNMEGKEVRLWHQCIDSVRGDHDRCLVWCGERHARLVHASGWHGADGLDAAGRSGVWRCWLRPVRHADLRHPGRVHRGPDDWPHAGIPGQEDRGARDEADVDGHPGDAHPGAAGHGDRRHGGRWQGRHCQPRRAWIL